MNLTSAIGQWRGIASRKAVVSPAVASARAVPHWVAAQGVKLWISNRDQSVAKHQVVDDAIAVWIRLDIEPVTALALRRQAETSG
jgi:hypothetical protein